MKMYKDKEVKEPKTYAEMKQLERKGFSLTKPQPKKKVVKKNGNN